jgi:hypothetical protein
MDKTETITTSGEQVVGEAVNSNSLPFLEQAFIDFL